MSSRRLIAWSVLIIASVSPAPASAYKIYPLLGRNIDSSEPPPSLADAVHEDITLTAISCANDFENGAGRNRDPKRIGALCLRPIRTGTSDNSANAIVVGTWWNDDPRQVLMSGNILAFASSLNEAKEAHELFNASNRKTYTFAMGLMFYRSHYGDLQVLHSMATRKNEPAAQTRDRIMLWMEFAYSIATGAMDANLKIKNLPSKFHHLFAVYPRNASNTLQNSSIGYLFKPRSNMDRLPIHKLALGSMLHVVQDSYAAGHARRTRNATANCPYGRILQFHTYGDQKDGRHGTEDLRRALLHDMNFNSWRSRFNQWSNPLEASTRILVFANRKSDWKTVVEPYLRERTFCLEADAHSSDGGEFR